MAQKGALIDIVRTKTNFVKSQTEELHGMLDDFINKEISAALTVVETERQDLNRIRIVNSRLDKTLEFVLGKCAELQNFVLGSCVEGADFDSQQLTADMPTSFNISSFSENPKCMHRIEALELAVSTLNQKAEQLTQSKDEQEDHFQTLERKLEILMTEIAKKEEKELTQCHGYEKKRKIDETFNKSHLERFEKIEAQLQHLLGRDSYQIKKMDLIVCSLQDLIRKVQGECEDISSAQKKEEEEIKLLKRTNEDFRSQLDVLKKQCGHIMVSLPDLSARVDATELSVNTSVATRQREEDQRRELEDRVHAVETQQTNDLVYCQEKLEKVDSLYKQVCQMVASKVASLERLQDILNRLHLKKVERQEEMESQETEGASNFSSGAGVLEIKRRKVLVGFTASWGDYNQITENSVLIFTDISCNESSCYNHTTGVFRAPCKGLYLTSLTLRQRESGKISAQVSLCTSRSFFKRKEQIVCKSLTNADGATCCGIGVVSMKAGDTLFVRAAEVESKPRLSFYSTFSCILIACS